MQLKCSTVFRSNKADEGEFSLQITDDHSVYRTFVDDNSVYRTFLTGTLSADSQLRTAHTAYLVLTAVDPVTHQIIRRINEFTLVRAQ